ncbi:hypothetical protein RhiJN_22558 [Ceratobasidium sp. AG-Ba]|nr:hypothetical protein RhiJN_22558 [Ceratobasidium sp. AG-Ba]
MITKTLNIYGYDLREDTTIMLMFEPPDNEKLFKTHFPVVWKVITMPAGGHCKARVQYTARPAFGCAETDENYVVGNMAWEEIKSGIRSSISGEYFGRRRDSDEKGYSNHVIVCTNSTRKRANLSIGFVKGEGIDQRYTPVLFWKGVGAGCKVSTQFTPVLNAYVTQAYKSSEMLRWETEVDPIWSCNLDELDDVTGWNLFEDYRSGAFYLEESWKP